MPVPLLILSDAPSSSTGLGRITRELATFIHAEMQDTFRVATFGFGGTWNSKFPFRQYPMTATDKYVPAELPRVWEDFAGEDYGVILTIWNPGWQWWLAEPEKLQPCILRTFIEEGKFEKWGYFPIDGDTWDHKLPDHIVDIMETFDRILVYTDWAKQLLQPLVKKPVECLPHPIDTSKFYAIPRAEARFNFMGAVRYETNSPPMRDDIELVGVVATNTQRKDWFLAFQVCRQLLNAGRNIGLWAHTDIIKGVNRYWDLGELARQFGMEERTVFTTHTLTDDEMRVGYSACNYTLAIGAGEGWGYPIAESLACGVPVIHGDYAGGAEMISSFHLVQPQVYRGEGLFGIRRPVFDPAAWTATIMGMEPDETAVLPLYIEWAHASSLWKKWLTKGVWW